MTNGSSPPTHATRRLLEAVDPRAAVAVAFHLPSVRRVASDEQVRGMFFLGPNEPLDSIEAIAMVPGGAAVLRSDGTVELPPQCPFASSRGESLLAAHARELEALGDMGSLCIGLGSIGSLPPVALALDYDDRPEGAVAQGAAIFAREPRGEGLDLLAAVGARFGTIERLADGRVRCEVENRLAAHFDAARLCDYQRTTNCNRFFLMHGSASGDLEQGLEAATRARIAAGRARLSKAVVELAHRAIDEGLALAMRPPGSATTKPYGDLVPLGFLGLALDRIVRAGGEHAPAAAEALAKIHRHLETHRVDGCWPYARGSIATSTDTALVSLAGVAADPASLERFRGVLGGYVPQRVSETGGDGAMKRSAATVHWEEEDVPTTALLEARRLDDGLAPSIGARWFLARYPRWSGLYFTTPTLGLWAMARFAARLERWNDTSPAGDAAAANQRRFDLDELREVVRTTLLAHRHEGGFGRFDPVLANGFAVLAIEELGLLDRTAAAAQLRVLDAWETALGVETPFHSTIAHPTPGTIEDLFRQSALPASDDLHGRRHQASLYEDPHRLVVAAIACLALHADADPAIKGRLDPPKSHRFRVSMAADESAIPAALRHVRPYAEPPPTPSRFGGPGVMAARRCTLVDAMRSTMRRLGPRLVTPAAEARVLASISEVADEALGASTFGVEVRLHDGDDRIDFLWCAARAYHNLASLHELPAESFRAARLASLWDAEPGETRPPIALMDSIWFEFDLDDTLPPTTPPAFFFGPSDLQLRLVEGRHGPRVVAATLARLVRSFGLDGAIAKSLRASIDAIESLPEDLLVFQTGLMLPRDGAPLRLCFVDREGEAFDRLIAGLADAGLDAAVAAKARELAAVARECGFHTSPCVDFVKGRLSSRIGLEFHRPRQPRTRSSLDQLAEAIVAVGAADADRTADFLAAEGWDELDANGGCNRVVAHLKCLLRPAQAGVPDVVHLDAKGYLGLNRSRRPKPMRNA